MFAHVDKRLTLSCAPDGGGLVSITRTLSDAINLSTVLEKSLSISQQSFIKFSIFPQTASVRFGVIDMALNHSNVASSELLNSDIRYWHGAFTWSTAGGAAYSVSANASSIPDPAGFRLSDTDVLEMKYNPVEGEVTLLVCAGQPRRDFRFTRMVALRPLRWVFQSSNPGVINILDLSCP